MGAQGPLFSLFGHLAWALDTSSGRVAEAGQEGQEAWNHHHPRPACTCTGADAAWRTTSISTRIIDFVLRTGWRGRGRLRGRVLGSCYPRVLCSPANGAWEHPESSGLAQGRSTATMKRLRRKSQRAAPALVEAIVHGSNLAVSPWPSQTMMLGGRPAVLVHSRIHHHHPCVGECPSTATSSITGHTGTRAWPGPSKFRLWARAPPLGGRRENRISAGRVAVRVGRRGSTAARVILPRPGPTGAVQ